jgi:4-hydroxy-tetrahydrodipicolinate synthase
MFPARTLRPLADDTLARLAESSQIIGLRDASADISRPMRLSRRLPVDFRLLSGDDATTFGFIASGGDGAISQISNVAPDLCRTIFSSCRQGRMRSARHLQKRLVALEACLSRESPAALKYALSLLGLMQPSTRLLIVELDDAAKAEVARAFVAINEEELVDVAEG